MKRKLIRISLGVAVGMAVLAGAIGVLTKTLGNLHWPILYAGKTIADWRQQLYQRDAAASNAAFAVVGSQVIPQLVDTMFHDTSDSTLRVSLVDLLNELPGVQILYATADVRRSEAIRHLGELGPAAKAAVPRIIKLLVEKSPGVQEAAVSSLGKIHSEPETVIPLLIRCLDDDRINAQAASALGEFGSLAKPAVPKLLPMLQARDKDDRRAARDALLKIDAEAAAKAGVRQNAPTNALTRP